MNKAIKILLIDDDEEDFLLTQEVVNEIPNRQYQLDWISSYEEGKEVMLHQQHDVYLIDYQLGNMIGLELIKEILDHGFDAPLILLTGLKDSQIDENAAKAGAADYLVKGGLTPEILDRSIRYCVAQYAMLKKIKQLNTDLEKRVKERTEALESANNDLAKSRQDLQNALVKEKELNELKSRFVTTASHEFRTPLAAVLSSADLVSHYVKLGQEEGWRKHIERIKSSVKNLTDILNDFLSLEKLEQGKLQIEKMRFSLFEFCEDVIKEMNGTLKKGQEINCIYKGDKEITEDKKILRNILLNLLSNASKYSRENKEIELNVEVDGKTVSVEVKDKGIGIPQEEQKNLFSKFYRARNAINFQGTGMGLNIVKHYTELLGGTIGFTSKLEEGTVFKLELPRNKE